MQCPVTTRKGKPCGIPGEKRRDGYCHVHDPRGIFQVTHGSGEELRDWLKDDYKGEMPPKFPPPKEIPKESVVCYTDGACSGNPGPGGWGFILLYEVNDEKFKAIGSGGKRNTTNNEMEFMAAYHAIRAVDTNLGPSSIVLHTDSSLLIGALDRGWNMKAPHLRSIRDRIFNLLEEGGHSVSCRKVKAHSGIPLNEEVDRLAVRAIP